MASIIEGPHRVAIHPFHAAMLAGTVPLSLGALLADYAYWTSYEITWSDFASWLIVGGLLFGAIALASALVGWFRAARHGGHSMSSLLALSAAWLLGLFNTLVHARDAWAIMPTALVLSALVAALACLATWLGFARLRGGAR